MRRFLSKLLLFSSIILTVIGCQKDELTSQILDGTGTILRATVDVAADTKMSFTDNNSTIDIAWELDDEFTLYDADGALMGNLKCISVNNGTGDFAITESLSIGANYTAIYPASTAETLDAAKAEKLDILSTQDGSLIENLSDACYMLSEFSYSQNATISFTHQLSVMTFTFTFTHTEAISKLDFKDGANGVTYSVVNLTCNSNEEYTTYIMINPTKDEDINEDKATERTLSFTLYDGENNICSSYATQSTVAFIAGCNYDSPFSTLEGIDLTSGLGTADDPIIISTYDELYAVMSLINNYPEEYSDLHYTVTDNIDLTNVKSVTKATKATTSSNFTPIGSLEYPFKGVFNGNGHTISGLSINCDDPFAGFFGYTDGAIIKNLTIEGTISSTATDSSVGGIVAVAQNETLIINCSSNVTVSGSDAGGIVGTITDSSVVNSFNEGVVDGSSNSGGIVGATGESATSTSTEIINCVNKADVTGTNTGAITGGSTTESDITVTDCYYDEVKYTTDSSNVGEVTGKTTEYIESDTFINELNNNVIDYNDSVGSDGETAAGWADDNANFGSASNNEAPTEKVFDIELVSGIYEIKTANGLKAFADLVNGSENSADALYSGDGFATFGKTNQSINGKLTTDIDLSTICGKSINDVEVNWTPILDYTGTFDGDYHEVSGLYINTGSSKSALFGSIYGATIKNIGVDGSVYGGSHTAGLVGYCTSNSTVQNCYNKVSVSSDTDSTVGGVGGLVGQMDYSNLIINSYNDGFINSSASYSGSLLGRAFMSGGKVINCYNLADVYKGGLIGLSSATVTNCYNVGKNDSGDYCAISTSTNSYYASDTSGQTSSGATSMTLEEMTSENFVNILNNGVYDYNSSSPTIEACVWKAGDDGYPTFDYENTDATYTYFTAGGSGTESEPYQISTADGINDLSEFVASGESTSGLYFELTSDIDLGGIDSDGNGIEGNEFTAIGDNDIRFNGIFDGGGYEISGLYINKADEEYQGLFGAITGSTIKNLGVSGIITGKNFTGAIAGIIDYESKIIGCYNKATITGSGDVGGLVGCMYNYSSITGCYNVGDVDNLADETVSGGIAGAAVYTCYITSCFSTGKITAPSGAGGILGKNYLLTSTVSSCYWIAATDGDAEYGIAENSSNTNATELDDISSLNSSEGDPSPIEIMNNAAASETGTSETFIAGNMVGTDFLILWYEIAD